MAQMGPGIPQESLIEPSCKNLIEKKNYHFGGPYNKDYTIFGSILGVPYVGKLPLVFIGGLFGDSLSVSGSLPLKDPGRTAQTTSVCFLCLSGRVNVDI